MKHAILTVGVAASGKSTWTRSQLSHDTFTTNRDLIRTQVAMTKGLPFSWTNWKWKWEKEVTEIQQKQIVGYSNDPRCQTLIISDTNLNLTRRNNLILQLEELGFEVTTKFFPVSFEEAVKRDLNRPNPVGQSVIARQFEQWNKQCVRQYSPNPNNPAAVICDIDGTLAHMKDRGPFEWSKVYSDDVDTEIKNILKGLKYLGYDVIFTSGRDECCREITEDWLYTFSGLNDFALFMRPANDNRPDTVVKLELFWNYIADNYDVKMVVDDRPKIARAWRSIGLKVIQVGNPYIEF